LSGRCRSGTLIETEQAGMKMPTEPERSRMIVDIGTLEEARKVEETIKTGYIEATIESIVSWIGVEEDLAESYAKFSKSLATTEERELANTLQELSNSDADILRRKLVEFEALNSEYRKRIGLVKKLTKSA